MTKLSRVGQNKSKYVCHHCKRLSAVIVSLGRSVYRGYDPQTRQFGIRSYSNRVYRVYFCSRCHAVVRQGVHKKGFVFRPSRFANNSGLRRSKQAVVADGNYKEAQEFDDEKARLSESVSQPSEEDGELVLRL